LKQLREHGILRVPLKEKSMSDKRERDMVKIARSYASHIPMPYGCLSVVALILGAVATLILSSLAIGIAILK
jgi:hypothetical protein